jgi:hypothetical protein
VSSSTAILAYGHDLHSLAKITELTKNASDPAFEMDLARSIFPGRIRPWRAGTLGNDLCPAPGELFITGNAEVGLVCYRGLALDRPSRLPAHWLDEIPGSVIVLHACSAELGFLAQAMWDDGELIRSLSISTDLGVIEDIGEEFWFETDFWAGARPPARGIPTGNLYFDPLELAAVAAQELLDLDLSTAARGVSGQALAGFTVAPADLRATPELGSPVENPAKDTIFQMLQEIDSGVGSFLLLERTSDATGQTYAQVLRRNDGRYVIEHRAGAPERHFGTMVADARSVYRLLTGWAFQLPGWDSWAQWSRVRF